MLVISGCCGNGKMQFFVSVRDHLARTVSLLHTLSADMDLFLPDCFLCCFLDGLWFSLSQTEREKDF